MGRIAQMLLSLLVGVLTARYLGPSNYGVITYVGAYVAFFTSLCTLGINSVIIKNFVDHPLEQGTTIGTAIVLRMISSMLSVLCIVGITMVIDKGDQTIVAAAFLCSLALVFQIFDTFNYWFQSRYESKTTAIATLIAYVSVSVYKLILLALGKNVFWFAFASSVDYIVLAVILFYVYKRSNGPKLAFSTTKAKSLLRSSYHYILSGLMVVIYGQTDKLMIKQMLDSESVAYYSLATTICSMWTFVLQALIDSLYPSILRLKNVDQAAYERKNRQLYAIVFYVSCFVSIGFQVLGSWAVNILYGEAYMPSVPILKTVTWYTAFSFLGVARNAWIVSEGKQKYLKFMYSCAAVMNVIMNAMLIPSMGAIGAAVASLITQIFTSIILPMCFKEMRPNAKLMLEAMMLRGLKG